jgi:hypothetical protein
MDRARMTARVAISAKRMQDLELAGLPEMSWVDGAPLVRMTLYRDPGDAGGILVGDAERRVATAGAELWRRTPWPVNDALFAFPEPLPRDGVLVVGGDPEARHEIVSQLGHAGAPVRDRAHLTASDLAATAIVVYAPMAVMPGPGQPLTLRAGPLPVDALAVLAAGRLLVAGRCEPAFGLRASLDHLAAGNLDEAIRHAIVGLEHWDAFAAIRAWGTLVVQRHRSSLVLPTLAADLMMAERGLARARAPVG